MPDPQSSDHEATITDQAVATALLFLHPDRLAVAGALATAADSSEGVQSRTDLSAKAVLKAIGDLRAAGFVTLDDGVYALSNEALSEMSRTLRPRPAPMDPSIGWGMTDEEIAVLREYFSGRRLQQFPASATKREIIAQRLALEFEPGQRYTEAEVNELLGEFHPDTAALRRGLFDLSLLDRETVGTTMLYWRSGGRV